jgi:predicted DNA-binding transcriptional regulator AlpA
MTFMELQPEEIKELIREELATFFANRQPQKTDATETDEIGGLDLAVAVTGYARATIYTLASRRLIPHSKRGKKLFFSRRELVEWIQAGKRRTGKELLNGLQPKPNDPKSQMHWHACGFCGASAAADLWPPAGGESEVRA